MSSYVISGIKNFVVDVLYPYNSTIQAAALSAAFCGVAEKYGHTFIKFGVSAPGGAVFGFSVSTLAQKVEELLNKIKYFKPSRVSHTDSGSVSRVGSDDPHPYQRFFAKYTISAMWPAWLPPQSEELLL
jgi:hypothetical protein